MVKDGGVSEHRGSLVFHPVWIKSLEWRILDVLSCVFVGQGCRNIGLNCKANVRH